MRCDWTFRLSRIPLITKKTGLAALLRYVESQLWEDVIGGREKRSHALRLWIWVSLIYFANAKRNG